MTVRLMLATLLGVTVSACATSGPPAVTRTSDAEEIYVFRTHRTSKIEGATLACAGAPFALRQEDFYELSATSGDDETGLMTDPNAAPVPGFTACLGEIQPDGSFGMYAIGRINGRPYTGLNTCAIAGVDKPVEGAFLVHCHGELQDVPEGYVGGFLTSNTLASTREDSAVPGYTATSIITMRLWPAPAPG